MTTTQGQGRRRAPIALVLAAVVLAILAVAAGAFAQAGGALIRTGDVLQMVVPGRPDLDRALVVDPTGHVDIPQVGEVRLEGMGLGEAGVLLKQRLRLIAPTLDVVELTRGGSATFRVYVIGQVGEPGLHEFPMQPTVWEVMRAAGGPLPTADLSEARVIREEDGRPGSLPMDLSRLLDGGEVPGGTLRDGDTLVVPALPVGVSGVPSSRGVKVFGAVAVPSIVPVDGPTPLMDVLMLAGAPTSDANMRKVWWVHAAGDNDQAQLVNLRQYLEKGDPAGNPLIHPGDTIQVTIAKPGRLQTGFAFVLGTAAAISAVYLAINQSSN